MILEALYLPWKREGKQNKNADSEKRKSYFKIIKLDYEKNRKEEQRQRANEWDNILSSEYDETAEDRSKNTLLFGVHEGVDSRLKEKLTSKLERNTPESYAECCPGISR
ncbi:protein Red [Nephila pilipes]|uniref:Protein Red n=1 Tax=Nephila pilipes TaxID=299642 RepID=A0A8X6QSF6_NEPPI|nr:protein Red [Nephila pilipes]